MKKIIIIICLLMMFLITFLLQVDVFTKFTIAGVMPNLFIILTLFIGLFMGRRYGVILGSIYGMILDLWIGRNLGISVIALACIGLIGGVLDKNFSKDSRITILIMNIIVTLTYEIIIYAMNCIIYDKQVEILLFIKILTIEIVYNTLITAIVYPIIKSTGYFIEEQFKANKILTRYF